MYQFPVYVYTSPGDITYMNGDHTVAYLRKYDSNGESGNCASTALVADFIDIPFTTSSVNATPVNKIYTGSPGTINLVTSPSQFHLATLLCSSKDLCSTVKLDDPGKICRLNTDVSLTYTTNPGCDREPLWIYDNNFIRIQTAGSGKLTVRFLKKGNTSLVARITTVCDRYDDTLKLSIDQQTTALDLGADTAICSKNSYTLSAPVNFTSYTWQDGSTSQDYLVNSPGKYWVSARDQNDCTVSDTILINKFIIPPSGFLPAFDTICNYSKLVLVPVGKFASYNWSNGTKTETNTIDRPGTYSLEVVDKDGCRSTESITVVQKNCQNGLYIPNAFTPNRDGINDVFRPKIFGPLIQYQFVIYNRYGEIVFSAEDPSRSWDGFYKGKPANVGNYAWKCSYQLQGSEPAYEKGFLMLIR